MYGGPFSVLLRPLVFGFFSSMFTQTDDEREGDIDSPRLASVLLLIFVFGSPSVEFVFVSAFTVLLDVPDDGGECPFISIANFMGSVIS